MKDTLTNVPKRFTLYAAGLALSALIITLLAASFSAGPTQAQNSDNTYTVPQPCGPNAGNAFQPEPHEVTTGHFALFDAYWEWTKHNPNEGIMHTNDCPPKMVAAVGGGLSRAVSNIDLGEAIMHVKDVHQATVVANNTDVTEDGELSLEEYPEVRVALGLGENDPVPENTKVWWLRLDDLDTTGRGKDETSALGMGFSTALFDSKYWLTSNPADEGGNPMRYMLETARYRNVNPAEAPHFFAYEAPKIRRDDVTRRRPVLDSTNVDVDLHDMTLDPGQYRALQWIFTKPGTYVLQAHLQGFVRKSNPHQSNHPDYDANWKRISSKEDETSEIKDYVFQVGDALAETEPPMFGVNRSVHDDARAGAHVGEPVRVFNLEVPDPRYTLSGAGSDKFSVNSRTNPNAAQIVLAAAGEDLSNRSYDLVLEVSDGKDHEGNNDRSIDHSIAVEIDVVQQPLAYIIASSHTPAVGDSVSLRLNVFGDLPDGVTASNFSYTVWETSRARGVLGAIYPAIDATSLEGTATVRQDSAGRYKYTPEATYTLNNVEHTLHGDPVTITWHNP